MTATNKPESENEDLTVVVQILIVIFAVPLVGIDLGFSVKLFRMIAGF